MSKNIECPLGHECEKCRWLIELKGKNPMTGDPVDREECALVALVLTMNQLNKNSLDIAVGTTGTRALLHKIIENAPKRPRIPEDKKAVEH